MKRFSTFFESEADRNLWIRLNAENQIEWEKSLTYWDASSQSRKPTQQALNPRSMESAVQIATNQLVMDEKRGNLRFSLDDLLTMSQEELTKKHTEHCFKPFLEVFGKNDLK